MIWAWMKERRYKNDQRGLQVALLLSGRSIVQDCYVRRQSRGTHNNVNQLCDMSMR